MADPVETTIDIKQDGILLLPQPQYARQYPRLNQLAIQEHRTLDEWIEFNKAVDAKQDVYVQFIDPGSKRYGSIGKAKHYVNPYRHSNPKPNPLKDDRRQLEITWDGRRNSETSNTAYEPIAWLPNHTGGTVWHYDRTRKPVEVKPLEDRLGRPIEVGAFCSYILYHFDSDGAAGIYFGKVTKIERDGTVWFKNIKLKDDDRVAEKRVKDNSNIVMLTKDLMEQLMLARLSVL